MSTKSLTLNWGDMLPQGMPWSSKKLFNHLGKLELGTLQLRVGDMPAVVINAKQPGPRAELCVHNPLRLLQRLFWRGDLGFAESYMAGEWDSPDLERLLYLLSMNLHVLEKGDSRHPLLRGLVTLQHRLNKNTLKGSRRNISAHYDLGNDFYRRWLDPSMTYSAAVFEQEDDLEAAQRRKYDLILKQIDARTGDHILEIGCGWGGFAEHAARSGIHVTGITLSREQLAYARERIERAGLNDRVELKLCDYRELDDQFDHIVSIEMFEAVGQEYWPDYFEVLRQCLKPGGKAALQVITIDESQFDDYASNPGGFIQQYIFPGGMLPTKRHLQQLTRQASLEPVYMFDFGMDYADTLAVWRERFEAQSDWLNDNGYDERFRRTWSYYLAFCEAGFRDRRIDVVHYVLEKP